MRFSLAALSCIISVFGRVTAPSFARRVAVVNTTSPQPDTTEVAYSTTSTRNEEATTTTGQATTLSDRYQYRARTDSYGYASIDSYTTEDERYTTDAWWTEQETTTTVTPALSYRFRHRPTTDAYH